MKRFTDSTFIIAAWRQQLETLAPTTGVCSVGERIVTAGEVLSLMRGRDVDPIVATGAMMFLEAIVTEACRAVRGRFAMGLVPNKK